MSSSLQDAPVANLPQEQAGAWHWPALILSALLHPLIMPTLVFLLLFIYVPGVIPTAVDKRIFLGFIFAFTYVAPALLTLLMWRVGLVKQLTMQQQGDRNLPYVVTCALYAFLTYLFAKQKEVPDQVVITLTCLTVSVGFITAINLVWKISAHSLGMGGSLALLILASYIVDDNALLPIIVAFTFLSGVLMTARLYLRSHNLAQVLVGFVAGFALNLAIALWMLR